MFIIIQTVASLSFLVVETGLKQVVRVDDESIDFPQSHCHAKDSNVSVDVRITGMWPNLCRSISRHGVLSTTGLAVGASVLYLSPITRECECCGTSGTGLDRGVSFHTIPSTVMPHDDSVCRRACISQYPSKVSGDRCTGCAARIRGFSGQLGGINASAH